MNELFACGVTVIGFYIGFYLGRKKETDTPAARKKERMAFEDMSSREYRNFLSYDGSEQE